MITVLFRKIASSFDYNHLVSFTSKLFKAVSFTYKSVDAEPILYLFGQLVMKRWYENEIIIFDPLCIICKEDLSLKLHRIIYINSYKVPTS